MKQFQQINSVKLSKIPIKLLYENDLTMFNHKILLLLFQSKVFLSLSYNE